MAGTPVIRTAPVSSITGVRFDTNITPADNSKTLGADVAGGLSAASFIILSSGFSSNAGQLVAAGDCIVGNNLSVSLTDDTLKGPLHGSTQFNGVSPVGSAAGSVSLYVEDGTNGGYYHFYTSANYTGGWSDQMIADINATPSGSLNGGVGSGIAISTNVTHVGAYMDLTAAGESMFETVSTAISWVGREITVDGGTSTAGNEITFESISDRDRLTTRSAIAPFTGNFYGHVEVSKAGTILRAPIQLGNANGTTVTYMLELDTALTWIDQPVNIKFYRIDVIGAATTIIWGSATSPRGITIATGGYRRWALNTSTQVPAGFTAYACTFKNGRAWTIGSTSTFTGCTLIDISDITLNALTDIAGSTFIQTYLKCAFIPAQALFANTTIRDVPLTEFGITITGAYGTVSMVLDNVKFQNNIALRDIDFAHTGTINLSVVNGGTSPSYTVSGGGTVNFVQSVDVTVSGVTEGTPITVIADETVGTITKGDVILSAFADSTGQATIAMTYEPAFDPSGLDVISRARNQGVVVAAIADNGGVFTDETAEASSPTTNDMNLLPAVPALNDAYYYGHNEQFSAMKQDVSTILTFSAQPTIIWEYWNGTAWTALAGVVDGTNGFETTGENKVTYTLPSNWATTTINAQGPLYYIRARLSVAGTITQVPLGLKATLDTLRYLPYAANRTIVSGTGLSDIANWAKDIISQF